MIKCYIRKRIYRGYGYSTNKDIILQHIVELPIEPFIGLYIYEGRWEATIKNISYDVYNKTIICYTEPDETLLSQEIMAIEDITARYVMDGWNIL